jgi:hypothetical protein
VFAHVCFVHLYAPAWSNLDPRVLKCVLCYPPTQKGYKCNHPLSQEHFVSMDVIFFESQSYFPSTQTSLQGESQSQSEDKFPEKFPSFSLLPILATLPEHKNQRPTDESSPSSSPTDEPCSH